jgi:hypothetical protein
VSDEPQDQVNRFVIVVIALLVIFASLVVVMLAWGAPEQSIDQLRDFAGFLDDNTTREGQIIVSLLAAVIVLLMLTVIILEITPSPTQRMRVRSITSGEVSITTPEMAERIEQEVRAVPHVAEASAIVAARGKRAEVALELHVDSGADLALTADEACRRTQALVVQGMGIRLAKPPRARLHYRELRLRGTTEERPATTPAAMTTGWERPDDDAGRSDEQRPAGAGDGAPGAPEETEAKAD